MNKIFKKIILASFISFAIFFNFSCKSTAISKNIDATALLVPNSVIYFSIPVKSNEEFLCKAISSFSNSQNNKISEKDVNRILKRFDRLNISLDEIDALTGVGVSASGNFPKSMSKLFLTKKNGWKKGKFKSHDFFEHSTGYRLSIISSDIACLSPSQYVFETELSRYDTAISGGDLNAIDFAQSDTDITFYIPNGSEFINNFFALGFFNISGIDSISGKLVKVDKKEQFDTSISLLVTDKRMTRAIMGMLKFVFSDFNVTQTSENEITISQMTFDWNQIFDKMKQ